MKSRLLAMLVCAATIVPLIGQAREREASCRFVNEEIRQRAAVRNDGWSAGLVALDQGDIEVAQYNFERALAANPGDAGLIIFIANLYRQGACGLPKNLAKAAAIYRDGAVRGGGGAMLELALMLWHGQGVREDRAKAVHLFRQGALAFGMVGGKADAVELDGLVNGPIPPELVRELDWVQNLVAKPGMGRIAADKLLAGPSPDYVSACRYMAFAFEAQPDAETAYRLGMMHFEGRGVEASKVLGIRYLSRAASARHAEATAEIGRRILEGDVPAAHAWQALAWLLRAANLGAHVEGNVRDAKKKLSAAAVKEAEMQAHFLPPLALATTNPVKPCLPKGA